MKAYLSTERSNDRRNPNTGQRWAEIEVKRILAETKPKGHGVTTAQDLPLKAWRMGYIIEPRNPAVVAFVEALENFLREA